MPMLPFERIHILPFVAKEFGAEDRTVWLTVSTVLRDRQKEIVTPEALRESLPRYMNNPVWTFQHKQEWPVGHAVDYTVGEEETALKVFISEASETSRMVWGMINDRTLRAASFGFNAYSKSFGPHPDGTPDFAQEESAAGPVLKWLRMDYMESAVVTIPANQGAVRAFAKGLGLDLQVIFPEQDKAVTAFADLPLAPEETPWEWSAGGAQRVREWAGGIDNMDWGKYRKAHFWYDPAKAEIMGGYKLPFADVIGGGLKAVWRGVVAATVVMLGGRGGADIPEDERRGCYNHAMQYYGKFDKPKPEFKGEWPEALKDVKFRNDELDILQDTTCGEDLERILGLTMGVKNTAAHYAKSGRVLSAANFGKIEQAATLLETVLREANPAPAEEEGKAGDPSAPAAKEQPEAGLIQLPRPLRVTVPQPKGLRIAL